MATTAAELKRMKREIEALKKKVARLERRSSTGHRPRRTRKRIIQFGGLWESTPEITEQEVADVRKEMWGNLGERDL